jgi:hypothetical protein
MKRTAILPALLGAAVFLAACGGDGGGDAATPTEADGTVAATEAPEVPSPEGLRAPDDQQGGFGLAGLEVPVIGPSIVKTAGLSIEVEDDGFDDAFGRAVEIAGRYAGFVESSEVHGAETKSGRITLRVPVASFEAALVELRELGTVDREEIAGRDVSAEFVDLDARIRHLEAQEEVLLRFLGRAPTINSSLDVQRTLSDVQLQLERMVGQRRALRDTADFSTITAELFEPDAPKVVAQSEPEGVQNPKLSEAWDRAVASFFAILYGVVVSVGIAAPFAAAALVVLVVLRWARGRRPVGEPANPA